MNVASLELSRELDELTGWDDTSQKWYRVASGGWWAKLVGTEDGNNLFHYRGWCEVIGNIYGNRELVV